MSDLRIPAVIRGETIERHPIDFRTRHGQPGFLAPDPLTLLDRLPLRNPGALEAVHGLSTAEILEYLAELGSRLHLGRNELLQDAMNRSVGFSDMTEPVLRASYEALPSVFAHDTCREMADRTIGIRHLDGWAEARMADGRMAAVRAFGTRALHIIAGNTPLIAAATIARNAILRSDAIIKVPANDPLTAIAIARTMIEMAPEHPLTRRVSVAYWKGGDTTLEERLYDPANIEKIVAWGGLASVRHVTRYIRPGLELISMDPKRSATIIGAEAFDADETMDDVAIRAATDIGAINQLGCVNARVLYVVSGTDASGLARANELGRRINDQLHQLPTAVSTPSKHFDPELRAEIAAVRFVPDWYRVFGCEADEGGVIVSQTSEPVSFYPLLSGRVANIVPIDDPIEAVRAMNAYSQTVGIYPESLKRRLRDVLPIYGAQRLVSLGYATSATYALPHDGMEPVRRLAKWIVTETCDPDDVSPPWRLPGAHACN